MADGANDNLLCFCIREKQYAIITDADAEAVAVFELLAAGRKGIGFQREDSLGNPHLHLRLQSSEFLARIAGDVNLPAHALMPSSFIT